MAQALRVLFVCSGNKGYINPFIEEQAIALENAGCSVDFFLIKGKGWGGYVNSYWQFRKYLRNHPPDLIHAHYGLSGLMASLQKKIPVVTTFHGSDVNQKKIRRFSRWAARRSRHSIVVENGFMKKLGLTRNATLLPCGIDLDRFTPMPTAAARAALGLSETETLILFSSAFNNPVKNYPLAAAAVKQLGYGRLLELKGYSRNEICLLMNAANLLLLTSFSEGSPQVVKEALACNLPVVSTGVGDVPQVLQGVEGCSIVPFEATLIAETLHRVLQNGKRSTGRNAVLHFDNRKVADRLISIYKNLDQ